MDYASLSLFSTAKSKMAYLGQRHAVLAQNVANADTPGYVPKDVQIPDFRRSLAAASGRLSMVRTAPGHLKGIGGGMAVGKLIEREDTYETNPNKNKVSLEEEIQKISMNQAEYQKVTTIYRKTTEMFRTAIGRTS